MKTLRMTASSDSTAVVLSIFLVSCALPMAPGVAQAKEASKPPKVSIARSSSDEVAKPASDTLALKDGELGPQRGADIVSEHSPFADDACDFCHKGNAKNPGPLLKAVNLLCFDCHSEMEEVMTKRTVKHEAASKECTNCHNPHNSRNKGLLLREQVSLCTSCHTGIKTLLATATVKHGAMEDSKCTACHNPHASAVEKLLVQLPFDICVRCHSEAGRKDPAGATLTNFKSLLEANPVWHAPVAGKDCSACHTPHGGRNFRLLVEPYPAKFYAPYEPDNYALCFTCHSSSMVDVVQTTTATGFRDGARNLHYLHVNKVDQGRTCRACHEVHASKQPFQIRDSVPFGKKGWSIKLNYKRTTNGGSCDKTCHALKDYDRTARK